MPWQKRKKITKISRDASALRMTLSEHRVSVTKQSSVSFCQYSAWTRWVNTSALLLSVGHPWCTLSWSPWRPSTMPHYLKTLKIIIITSSMISGIPGIPSTIAFSDLPHSIQVNKKTQQFIFERIGDQYPVKQQLNMIQY